EVERRRSLYKRRAEERRVWHVRERQRNQERKTKGQAPESGDDRGRPAAEQMHLFRSKGAETADDRDCDVGQDRHLKQLDEPVGGPLEYASALAEKNSREDAGGKPAEDFGGKGHPLHRNQKGEARP